MTGTFPSIRVGLMVGTGGVPWAYMWIILRSLPALLALSLGVSGFATVSLSLLAFEMAIQRIFSLEEKA